MIENKIQTFRRGEWQIRWIPNGKFGFYLSLDFAINAGASEAGQDCFPLQISHSCS